MGCAEWATALAPGGGVTSLNPDKTLEVFVLSDEEKGPRAASGSSPGYILHCLRNAQSLAARTLLTCPYSGTPHPVFY